MVIRHIIVDKALVRDVLPDTDAPLFEKGPSLKQKVLRIIQRKA